MLILVAGAAICAVCLIGLGHLPAWAYLKWVRTTEKTSSTTEEMEEILLRTNPTLYRQYMQDKNRRASE